VYLEIGMEQMTGRTWIDSISVVALEQNQPTVIQPIENPKLAANKHEIQRGMSVPTMVTDSELRVIASWGANHIRLQMMMDGFPFSRADWIDEYAYRQWLDGVLQHVDSILPTCRKLGLKILLDMHTLPGGKNNPSMVDKIFTNKGWQWIYIKLWQEIADRYKNEPAIWGYDIANEPHEGNVIDSIMNWHDLAALTAKEIRKIDSTHVIVVESAQDANIEGLCRMQPINVSGVVYSFHFYTPLAFTHQGIYSKDIVAYPGVVVDRAWNVAGIRKVMNAVAEWQRKYSAAIYVGEFSAVRWAPNKNGDAYVDDCIKLFEENKWSWAYFAFRGGGFDGWSAEHNNDKDDHEMSAQPTDRQLLLMRWFAKNKKP
jgi:endoglucanase